MIADALLFLKDRLNRHFKSFSAASDTGASEDKVVFLDGDQKTDSIGFKLDKLTVLLYRIEKETSLPAGDPFLRPGINGAGQRVRPDISMNLYVLLVAKFADYAQGLNYLAQAVRFFQSNNVFDRHSAPELSGDIVELALDLVSLTTQQQNELWGLFRTHYVPSVAYRIRTVVFLDDAAQPSGAAIDSLNRRGLN